MIPLGPLLWRAETRELRAGDQVVRLTGGEALLLTLLLAGGVVTRDAVAEHALSGRQCRAGGRRGQRGADSLVSRLRQRLVALSGGAVGVLSERGLGYRLAIDAPAPPPVLRARLTGAVERPGVLVLILTAPAGAAALLAVGAEYEVRPAPASSAT